MTEAAPWPAGLAAALARCDDVGSACAVTAAAVRDAGHELISLYLEQGGRLRCYAVHGYGQLYDGIRPGVGVIGRAFADGALLEVRSVRDSPEYWAAADGVEHELAVPIRVSGRCAGVLNVESRSPMPPSSAPRLEAAADALGRRLEELGGAPEESPAQQLVRHGTALAAAPDLPSLGEALVAAAVDTAGLESAVLLLGSPLRQIAAVGPAAEALRGLNPATLRDIAGWVTTGGSSRTSGQQVAAGPLQLALAAAGLASFVLVPLVTADERLGVLVVGGGAVEVVSPDVVESLELLGALAAADVRSLRSAQQLRRQARTDDLTGLPHRRSFLEALRAALTVRVPNRSLAVVLLDLDGFKRVNDTLGHPAGDELLVRSSAALAGALRTASSELFRLGGDEFGTVLLLDRPTDLGPVCERLLEAVRALGSTVSIGAVVVADDEDEDRAVAAADAQLYGAKRAGRDRACLRS